MTKEKLKNIVLLAAPHTWAASVIPALFSAALCHSIAGTVKLDMVFCTLAVAVLMQSAVNAFDDYSDYKNGTDTAGNSPAAYDAVIVYGMAPKEALRSGIVFLLIAALAGTYAVLRCGIVPLLIGLAGGTAVLCYSFGPVPLARLPLGELVSGFVMGGLIPLAGSYMQLGVLRLDVLLYSLPVMLGVALIMFTNNACDIRRDAEAGRVTACCLLGEKRVAGLYRLLLTGWALAPALILAALGNYRQLCVYLFSLFSAFAPLAKQLHLGLNAETRLAAMSGINTLNIILGFNYMLALAIGG